jgi:predicted aminopeptidase
MSRVETKEVLNDPRLNENQRVLLKELPLFLNYLEKENLKTNKAYEKFIFMNHPRDYFSYLVFSAKPLSFELDKNWFPFVGSLPYLGFFSEAEQVLYGKKMKDQGRDVYLSYASAFSGLGYFEDPLFDSMLNTSLESFVETVAHEMVHLNFWVQDQTEFNEELASFGGFYLAKSYFRILNKPEYLVSLDKNFQDRHLFKTWISRLKKELTYVYEDERIDHKNKLSIKNKVLSHYVHDLKPKFVHVDYVGKGSWNNARILTSSMYTFNKELWEKSYLCLGAESFGDYLAKLSALLKITSEPYVALERSCKSERN